MNRPIVHVDSAPSNENVLIYENNSDDVLRIRLIGTKGLGTAAAMYSSISIAAHGVATMNLPPDRYTISWSSQSYGVAADEQDDEKVLRLGALTPLYMSATSIGEKEVNNSVVVDVRQDTRTLISFSGCGARLQSPASDSPKEADEPPEAQVKQPATNLPSGQRERSSASDVKAKFTGVMPTPALRDCAAISASDQSLAPLSAVCEFVNQMDRSLPNFVCRQTTQRYIPVDGSSRSEQRRPDDLVADTIRSIVTYENGIDHYEAAQVGDTPEKQGMRNVSGTVAIGEFGSELLSVFLKENATTFALRERTQGPAGEEYVFKFHIPAAENHTFVLHEDGFDTYPDVEGLMWVNAETKIVHQLDVSESNINPAFSTDHARVTTLFGKVNFGDAGEFLLPTHSESTICDRRRFCTNSVTEWTKCEKFRAKSTITW